MLPSIGACGAQLWDACACGAEATGAYAPNPFVTHRFLSCLEESGSVGAAAGWQPCHLIAETDEGSPLGVMPLYAKSHSMGEYVFDHGWAEAFERVGGRYYPKLQGAVPFTPVTGPRFLIHPAADATTGAVVGALLAGARGLARRADLSSLHIAFCTEDEWIIGGELGLLRREGRQLHWTNEGYGSFAEFLEALSSRRRKEIRRERAAVRRSGLRIETLTGDDLKPEHWDAVWTFYCDTGARKWGMPYLTREFFDLLHERMRQDAVLFLASEDGRAIAGALHFRGAESLFGRYWGCVAIARYLHFELCYYRAIDFAIESGTARVEAGAGGEHKSARGYRPQPTYSLHWISDPGLRDAVERYLGEERAWVRADADWTAAHGAFRRGPGGPAGAKGRQT